MASETYTAPASLSETWYSYECPAETVDRKLEQAEALSTHICGSVGNLSELNDEIHASVMRVLADLIRDSKVALQAERLAAKRAGPVAESE
jgi:hypothetical protein